MSDDFSKFTAPRPDEELHQGVEVPVTFVMGTDGMPLPAPPPNLDIPSALSEDTFVCMADKRSFVVRDINGMIVASFEPKEVSRLPGGQYYVEIWVFLAAFNAAREAPKTFEEIKDMLSGFVPYFVFYRMGAPSVIVVEPIRPECAHYLRMQTDISADRTKRFLVRSCMKQQSESGEYTSVGDAVIAACNVRSPRHYESEQILDDFDQKQIAAGRQKLALAEFDVDQELAAEGLGVLDSR